MAYDAHANFAYSTVATAPAPAASGTSLVVATGDGAKYPSTPFNAVIWPSGASPTEANAEIVRVTGIVGDTLTIVRDQEGTSSRTIVVGDQIANAITAKVITDIEALVQSQWPPSEWQIDALSDPGCFQITCGVNDLVINIGYGTDVISIVHQDTGSGVVLDGNGQITIGGNAGGSPAIDMGGAALAGSPPPVSINVDGLPAANFALLRTLWGNLGSLDVPVVAANAGMVIPYDFEIPSGYDFEIASGGVLDII